MHLHRLRRRDTPLRALAAPALALYCAAGPVCAQTSGDLTLVSQYTARGVAWSRGPAVQLRIDHDTPNGWYAGAFASSAAVNGRGQGQLIVYAGRAGRLSSTLSWDAGFTRMRFSRDGYGDTTEFQAGLTLRSATARVFYSPDYYGQGRSVYLDLGGAYGLSDHLSLALHTGVLHATGSGAPAYAYGAASASNYGSAYAYAYGGGAAARDRIDARLALAAGFGDTSVQAGYQRLWRAGAMSLPRAHGLTASVSLRF